MSASQPVDLSSLFIETANAIRGAQAGLDRHFVEATPRVYSIPRVCVSARFEVLEDADHRILFFFGSKTTQSTAHTLTFTLVASPDPPPAIDGTISTQVTLPGFVVDRDTRQHLLNILFYSLGLPDEVECVFPGGARVTDFSAETNAICHVLNNQTDDSIGLIFLRVTDQPEQYLVVRLGKHPEGVFLICPASPRPLKVYSCIEAGTQIFYLPFQLAIQRFRDHLSGHAGINPDGGTAPDRLGSISVGPLVNEIWSGYVSARDQLARPVLVSPSPYPIGHELRGVELDLGYTVPLSGSEGDDSPFVQSRVVLRIPDRNLNPVVTIQLVSPEYFPTGDARTSFLDALEQRLHKDILPNLGTEDIQPYEDAFASSEARASAIVLLAYRGSAPINQFLVVWSTAGQEFAFTLAWDNGVFKNVALVYPMQIPGSIVLDEDAYVGFHNFLHAVRIWDLTGGWTLPVAWTGC